MPKLPRYNIDQNIAVPTDNGYWTPWHLAVSQHNEWLTSMCADWKIDHDPHEFGMQLGVNYKLHELTIALKDAVDIIQADANTEENYASLCRMGNALSKNSSTAWLLRQKADAVRETAKGIIRLSDECGSYKSDTAATLRVAAGYAERKAISRQRA